MGKRKKSLEKYITTYENWHPTAENNTVEVAIGYVYRKPDGHHGDFVLVSVWGDDDFGLEKEFPWSEREAALELYNKIVDHTTQKQMRSWGMVNA